MIYRPATAADRPAIVALLEEASLLTDDLPDDLGTFVLAIDADQLAGTAGVDVFGSTGLLRSVAVLPAYRGQRIGQQLIEFSQEIAFSQGVRNLYLITTTADAYFERLGYRHVDRMNVPETIAKTRQFSELCPSSAVVMNYLFSNENAHQH